MEDFVVSARKYRPDTFGTVIGQKAITETLKNSIRNGHLAQSFLFCGPRGVGKTTCARILARTINCTNPGPDMEPCGECDSCKGFLHNASQNIYELDAASNRNVEAMRALVEQVRIPPQVGKYKVYIIDEVHMLTSEAFNAFLKTLEEPPAYAKFILATTEKNKIIPTILSRCQIFDFKRITIDDMVEHLKHICEKENIAFEEEALRVVAQKADGGLRDALSMFDQIVSFSGNSITYKQTISMLNILDYETYFEMFGYFLQGNVPGALNLFNQVLENGFDGQTFVGGLSRHLRSLLMMKETQTEALVESSPRLRQRYKEQSEACSLVQLLSALEYGNQCDLQYRNSNHKRLLVEILLLQMVRIFKAEALQAKGGEARGA
ncbi:MAG: DNA polymerase III subunit gamma/tau, partial [Bacteroidales bacterium]|nr:DNA polymerase III subunit gamma/tau [Bacteroidales bacterium]